ncbi:unnamed protein product [Caenorhabditis sp. 36 PRJEB53466]|nr:unnamed protein product [Caenorhabditis sp. 36 PRJEB53466]
MEEELDYDSDNSLSGDAVQEGSDTDDSQQPKDRLDAIIDRKEKIATEKAFGLNQSNDKHLCVSSAEANALQKELGAGRDSQLGAVYVHGIESLDEFEIKKIFVDFRAEQVWKNGNDAIVQFEYSGEAAAMMLNMSKMMRRVRGRKKADEEGEVLSDDDDVEDGQIMQEKGDDVELIEGLQPNEKGIVNSDKKSDFVTVDVSVRDIPDGKWRVVTKHVPSDMFVIVRYPTYKEYRAMGGVREDDRRAPVKAAKKDFWTHKPSSSNRGGLNVFDQEGKELEWDYEHDTRFYDDDKKTEKVEKVELPKGIKVRGRGAVKCGFLFGEGSGSLACDEPSPSKKQKTSDGEKVYEKDDVVSRMGTAAHAIRPGRVERPMKDRIRFPDHNEIQF